MRGVVGDVVDVDAIRADGVETRPPARDAPDTVVVERSAVRAHRRAGARAVLVGNVACVGDRRRVRAGVSCVLTELV
jgi:hypothetical protein